MTGNTEMYWLVTDALKKKGRAVDQNQSVSGVTTICLMQHDTSPSHRVDQVDEWQDYGPQDLVKVSQCIQIAIDKM